MKSFLSKIRHLGATIPRYPDAAKHGSPSTSSEIEKSSQGGELDRETDETDDSETAYNPFPRVSQSRNDSRVELAQSLYGRGSGKKPVRFIVQDILGKGHYGLVFLALEETTGRMFGVKVMKKDVRNINKYAHVEESVLRLSRDCPFIIHMFSSFQTNNSFYLVMEYAKGGNLKQVIDEYGCLSLVYTRFVAAELVMALRFLHMNGVIHRDLKIQNILLTTERHLRLIDFGLSRTEIFNGDTTNSGCGTPFYMAPEILRRIPYCHEVDWWALGVVIYKVITGTFPFMGKTNPEVFIAVTRDSVFFEPHLAPDLIALLKGFLRKNPVKRLGYGNEGWKNVKAHIFFANIDWAALQAMQVPPPLFNEFHEGVALAEAENQVGSVHSLPSKSKMEMLAAARP